MNDIEEIKSLLERIAKSLEGIVDYLNNKEVEKNTENKKIIEKDEHKLVNDSSESEIEKFLNSKNIKIKSIKKEDESDTVLD
ncbi:MAG: hypothetical protein QME35_03795 [Thermoanaerobacteraceae bacterium]|nr:hypothetical protein [Thermoanaerobacteraceae bacterium]